MSQNKENRVAAEDFYIVMEWNAAETMRVKGFKLEYYSNKAGKWLPRAQDWAPCQVGTLYRLAHGQGSAVAEQVEPVKELKRFPLEFQDVPTGAAFSPDPDKVVYYPDFVNSLGVELPTGFVSFKQLADHSWKIWRGQGWHDCWK